MLDAAYVFDMSSTADHGSHLYTDLSKAESVNHSNQSHIHNDFQRMCKRHF